MELDPESLQPSGLVDGRDYLDPARSHELPVLLEVLWPVPEYGFVLVEDFRFQVLVHGLVVGLYVPRPGQAPFPGDGVRDRLAFLADEAVVIGFAVAVDPVDE